MIAKSNLTNLLGADLSGPQTDRERRKQTKKTVGDVRDGNSSAGAPIITISGRANITVIYGAATVTIRTGCGK